MQEAAVLQPDARHGLKGGCHAKQGLEGLWSLQQLPFNHAYNAALDRIPLAKPSACPRLV